MKEWETLGENAPKEKFFKVPIDHFRDLHDPNPKYEMRYLISDKYYNSSYGPILFYAGNEGAIPVFWNNSGFITETLAKEMGALVVFAEHRYYGKSMPFGKSSFNKDNLTYLTVPQAMRDYVDLLNELKDNQPELKERATVVVGGSYGGMLAAWMRMKYPQHFQVALSSSAPILYFRGTTLPYAYQDFASKIYYKTGGMECAKAIKFGFFEMTNMVYDSSMYDTIA